MFYTHHGTSPHSTNPTGDEYVVNCGGYKYKKCEHGCECE